MWTLTICLILLLAAVVASLHLLLRWHTTLTSQSTRSTLSALTDSLTVLTKAWSNPDPIPQDETNPTVYEDPVWAQGEWDGGIPEKN